MAKLWINDDEGTRLLSKYIVDNKHYGMWAIQVLDNTHEFFVVTEMGQVLGSKQCTMDGPTYALFDAESVKLGHIAPHLIPHDPDTGQMSGREDPNTNTNTGRSVKLKEFRLSISEYIKNKGAVYCCSSRRSEIRNAW